MEKREEKLTIGSVLWGFEVISCQEIPSVPTTVYMLRHQKTGAQVLYSGRDCENKTFAIAFETLPEDHTGVFHILEHSVLNGSEKYPVKEPFVNLLQSSLQTFLNAMTFPDKTVYPVSSRNQQDFENLMRVYLDGVFRPAIYKKPEIFRQEGWHYQMESADKAPAYNGVVFSEMKGAFSNVDNLMEQYTQQMLFPDNCYGYCSGGDPAHIPELTYEHFIRTHQRFYHPSNAKIFLDGDMALAPILEYLDTEYFSGYAYQKADFEMVDQKPVQKTMKLSYQVTEEQEQFSHLVLSKIICKYDDLEEIYAAKLLCDYLTGSNEAPLQRAILEAGLGQDVSVDFSDGVYQPFVEFRVRNTKPEHFDKICGVLRETVKTQIAQGLDKESLLASLERYAFRCREVDEPYGLMLCLKALDTWLYGGDPTAHWNTEPIFAALREKLEGDYFPMLLEKMLGDPDAMCRLEVLPSNTKGQQEAAREREKLHKLFDGWSDEERRQVMADYEKMTAFQQTPDSEAALACLPSLNLADIPLRPQEVKSTASQIANCPFVKTHIDTHGIVYLNLYFSLADFTPEQLQMTEVMNTALGELSTKQFAGVKLQSQIKTWLGGFQTKIELMAPEGQVEECTPYLAVSVSMLEENAPKALELLAEILLNTRFAEVDRMEELLRQNEYYMKQSLISSGHSYAVTKALSAFSVLGTLKEALSGETSIRWLTEFLETFRENGQEIMQSLAQLAEKIFCRSRLVLGAGGQIAESQLSEFLQKLPEGSSVKPLQRTASGEKQNGIEIPSRVNYCAMGHNLNAMGEKFTGSAVVLSSMMSFSYLWNAVRVQGGAYGTGMAARVTGDVLCYSYRDPSPEKTLETFGHMADFLEDFCNSGASLDDLIIGSVNSTDPLIGPGQHCQNACLRYLKGKTFEDVCQVRKEILETTLDDFRAFVEILRTFAGEGAVCVVGEKTVVDTLK